MHYDFHFRRTSYIVRTARADDAQVCGVFFKCAVEISAISGHVLEKCGVRALGGINGMGRRP